MKLKAWSPAAPPSASIAARSILSPWKWLKSVIRSASAPTALSAAAEKMKRSTPPQADHRVLAGPAAQDIPQGTAGEGVRAGRAGDVLDRVQAIALGIAATDYAERQVHADADAAGVVAGGVDAVPAVQDIGTRPAAEHVIAALARQPVVTGIPAERVVAAAAAAQLLDADQGVAQGVAARPDAGREVDRHPGAGEVAGGSMPAPPIS